MCVPPTCGSSCVHVLIRAYSGHFSGNASLPAAQVYACAAGLYNSEKERERSQLGACEAFEDLTVVELRQSENVCFLLQIRYERARSF